MESLVQRTKYPETRFRHPASLLLAVIMLLPAAATAQQISLAPVSAPTLAAAQKALKGDGQSGKNGPLAKVGHELALLYSASQNAELNAVRSMFAGSLSNDDYVTIDAIADGDTQDLVAALSLLGMRNIAHFGKVVSGQLPVSAIAQAATLTSLRSARVAHALTHAIGGEGDIAMRTDLVRTMFGIDGSGVTVGILSDSFDCLQGAADDVASGDLPPGGVTVLEEIANCLGAIDEGRGMAQLVYDVAPGADQLFHTAFNGQASFANGILALAAAGADVIVDDVIYFSEPMYQDGIVAQAVDMVVASGIPYFSSAGNSASQSWEDLGGFRDSGIIGGHPGFAGPLHDFDPGPGVDAFMQITLPTGITRIVLQWDEPHASAGGAGSASDLDFCLYTPDGSELHFCATDGNTNGDPVEILGVNNSGPAATAALAISHYEGPFPGRLKFVYYHSDMTIHEYGTNSATAYGHANAAGAVAVGAAFFADTPPWGAPTPLLEPYSSRGGIDILFDVNGTRLDAPDVRPKPEIVAPDGSVTTFFGSYYNDGRGPMYHFHGTSAAAPHAAALAALMLEKDPSLTPAAITTLMQASAIDMGEPGFDDLTGSGLIDALALFTASLPVELTSFKVLLEADDALLQWETASETNNAGFEVQWKMKQSGTWETLGFVAGKGTTTEAQSYQYRATNLAPGTHVFRLRQVDFDGTFAYSPEVEVVSDLPEAYQVSSVYPNPFNPHARLTVAVARDQQVRVEVFNTLGQRVGTLHEGRLDANTSHVFSLDGSSLPSGLYLFRVTGETFTSTQRALLLK